MLSRAEIEDIISEKDKFSDFVSASMVLALTKGLQHTKNDKTPLSSISNFVETMRKTRADLTGDSHENAIPRMMVNIQFGSAPKAVSLPIEGEVVPVEEKQELKSSKNSVSALEQQAPVDIDRFFGESNVSEELENTPEPVKNAVSDDDWRAIKTGKLDLWGSTEDEDEDVSAASTDS